MKTLSKLRRKMGITPEKALHDLNPTPAPHGYPTVRWARGMPEGRREGKTLAWYRGRQAGIYDAYLTIRRRYPQAAKDLIEAYDMNKDGNIGFR